MSTQDKVITVADRTTKALATAAAQLDALMTEAGTTLPSLLNQIEEKQSELVALTQEVENKSRMAAVELNLLVAENEGSVLNSLLEKRGLASITEADLKSLKSELVEAKKDNDDIVVGAVEQTIKELEGKFKLEVLQLTSAHDKAQAESKAKTDAAEAKVKFLEESLAQARETIAAEREARVEVAQHAATEMAARSAATAATASR